MSLRTIQRTLYHKPNAVASVASLTSAQAETIFPTTQGKVHIDFINFGTLTTEITIANPVVITLQHPSGSPTYATLVAGAKASPSIIPGFILPAGGLQATSNKTIPVFINVFYENNDS